MELKNPMLIVADIDRSVAFYNKVLGLRVILDFGANKTLTGGLDEVSVATGASLVAAARVTVQKIAIDAAGMGTLDGFALAEGGVIDLVNAPSKGSFSVSADLSGVTLPSSYSITVNGAPTRRRITISGGEIRVVAPGVILTVW